MQPSCGNGDGADTDIDDAVREAAKAMSDASEIVLGNFRLRADVEQVVRYPGRYMDPRGAGMWMRVMRLIEEVNHA